MLDTNILLDFLLIQWKEDENQKLLDSLKRSKDLKERYLGKKFTNYVTEWNLLEFRDVVEKIIEEKKLIMGGYAIHEFSEGRKALPLTTSEIDVINKIVNDVYHFSEMKTNNIELTQLRKICKTGISTFDALHLINANLIEGCEYFITRDNRLINAFKEKCSKELPDIKVVDRSAALELL